MGTDHPVALVSIRTRSSAQGKGRDSCPDCPASRLAVLEELVPATGKCLMQCASVPARAALPARWFSTYPFALVRRGVIVRQRVDTQGRVASVDAAGAGTLLPLAENGGSRDASAPTGYAATDSLVCLCPADALQATLSRDGTAIDLVGLQGHALIRVERLADARSRPTVEARVAALLCALGDNLSARRREAIPSGMLQRDLAGLIGARHESVCRVLKRFERDELIRRDDDGLHLLDRVRLEQL